MVRISYVSALCLAATSGAAIANDSTIPPEIYGNYAPGGDCTKQPRVTAGKGGFSIDTAAGKAGPLPISVCYSCAGGARYEGIQRWVYVKYGKDKWGGDNMPVTFMFNAAEKTGALDIVHDDTLRTPLGAPMNQVVQARSLKLCKVGALVPVARPAAPDPSPRQASSVTPGAAFANALVGLLRPAALPANSYYDWRHLETAPAITWAALPPQMLEKPMSNGEYFRRAGMASLAGQPMKVLAGGARSMVMNLYFRNDGNPIGEAALLAALRDAGKSVVPIRCPKVRTARAPTWYRLSASGKQPAILWVASALGPQQPWEGFSLQLDGTLPAMTAQEAAVYTDRC